MLQYPDIDPVAISLGPINIYWYAISYLVGIGLVWLTIKYRVKTYNLRWTEQDLSDIVFYSVLGVLLGGRISSLGRGRRVRDFWRPARGWFSFRLCLALAASLGCRGRGFVVLIDES